MNIKSVLLGTVAYTIVTFPLAVVWHVMLFEKQYKIFGYFKGEPNFILGLLTIVIQGVTLSFLYPYINFKGSGILKGLKYSMLIGIFFWSSHVLAFVAKQIVDSSLSFVLMETFYLVLQFGIYGVLIGLIYKNESDRNA
ncbi:MAG: hypothetical protein OQJ89_03005 [Kangiellaceae bacterium]|nr:hypothetical protein [Kangiellaceae bacterium]MCW8997308.1 hypothetical protein [Kangiellaceae bacterium]MCW9015915.1 hypothetical protein [Kangiellaceae bacterium]